jgi:outer membrane protein insertion porin family
MFIATRFLSLAVLLLLLPAAVAAQTMEEMIGQPVVAVRFEIEDRPDLSPPLQELSAVRVGEPLRQEDIRASIARLDGLGRYDDVRVFASLVPGGVDLLFRLTPRHPITALQVTGNTGIPVNDLRRFLQQRYGGVPSSARVSAVEETAAQFLRDEGYLAARVVGRTELLHDPDAATLVLEVEAGPQTRIRSASVRSTSPLDGDEVIRRARATVGLPYRRRDIDAALTTIEDDLRSRGYYEAQLAVQAAPSAEGMDIVISIDAGPVVEVRVTPSGALPGSVDEFIPIRLQGSADQDLLEDARARIERALRSDGFWKARAPFTRELRDNGSRLLITFTIDRGPRYYVERVEWPASLSLPVAQLNALVDMGRGDVFDEDNFLSGLGRVADAYRRAGYYSMRADPTYEEMAVSAGAGRALVILHPTITEGPVGRLTGITFDVAGTPQVAEEDVRRIMTSAVGQPYVEQNAAVDRSAIRSLYLDRGFPTVVVGVRPVFSEDGQQVTLHVQINEGSRVVIGDVSVVGNERVSTRMILDEMRLERGQAAGTSVLEEARRRLVAMGVFRRISISTTDTLGGNQEAHVIVNVVESPATTVGVGGGLEGGRYTFRRADDTRDDRLEFAPRGFFEITRRNLGGRNRALSFYSRVSLKRQDNDDREDDAPGASDGFGFTEYRVTTTYRERHAFRSETDLLLGVTSEQAVRTNFNFIRRGANAEALRALSPRVNVTGRYSLEFTRLFDVQFGEDDQPLIDRLFPQVRLSILSTGIGWDRRDNPITPTRGTLLTGNLETAARSIGSQVGYIKAFFQGAAFRSLDSGARTVVATRAMAGVARGFPRTVEVLSGDGTPVDTVVEDLPSSQRFFGGGSTTVRGFQLDRLGVDEIIRDGLSLGGNGIVVLNVELRRVVTRFFGRDFGAVAFIDGGNVFARASDLDLGRLRGAAGFGIRYDSPLGPLRLDLGFKLKPRTIKDQRERGWEYHLSIGEAF